MTLLTYDEAAHRLAITRRTLERMIERGDLRRVQLFDRTVRIRSDDLERLIKERTL